MNANHDSNVARATAAWGPDMPAWVRRLAVACDRTSQRAAGAKLDRSSGTISKILNRVYPGSYEEAETLVRAAFGGETVDCPAWGPIPLASCVRHRRRKGSPQNLTQRVCARTCPACPHNSDREEG